jgi:serine/threonine-protein kinase
MCPNAPLELEAVILRCLEKDPARRFHDVGELAIALYPFAPRRARISAERCCYVLKNAGLSDAEFELPSMNPPSIPGAESETNIPMAPSVMRSHPTAPVLGMQGMQNADLRMTGVQQAGGSSRWAFVALFAAIAAGGYAFWIHRSVTNVVANEATAATAAAAANAAVAAPAAAAPQQTAAAPAPAAPPVTAAAAAPEPGASGSAAASANGGTKGAPLPAKGRPLPPPPRPKAAAPAPTRPATGGRDELDVGF